MSTTITVLLVLLAAFTLYIYFSIRRMKNMPQEAESTKIVHLNNNNFNQATKNGISIVDFWAAWCMPCKMMSPILTDLADDENVKANICKVNVEVERQLASKFSVKSIPTIILLKNGKEIKRFVGVKQKEFLVKEINLARN
jgi:thioredoxin 1